MRRLLLLFISLLTACITEEFPADTRQGNFEAMWKTLDEHYCFFDHKREAYGLDWNEVHARYAPMISEKMSERQLFEVLSAMSYELRDGHVNLSAAHNVARYGAWFDDYPANYADTLERIYLGKEGDYMVASGLKYRILDDNIGYVRCATFDHEFGEGNLHEVMRHLALCNALIIDVRSNGGGLLSAAKTLASLFVNEETVAGYMSHKTGKGHADFSAPQAVTLRPMPGLRWQKRVAVLTNRRTYSAANSFVSYVKGLPGVIIVGDRMGGGSGMPFNTELPCGWGLRFSACPMYNREMQHIEMGIDPDVSVSLAPNDVERSTDSIIETARHLLQNER